MIMRASESDKATIVEVLSKSFDDNKSVNYIVRQGAGRPNRLKKLIAYAFEVCMDAGEVLVSEDRKCCALVFFPDSKKTSFKSLLRDMNLVLGVVGLGKIGRLLKREKLIDSSHPVKEMYYIWFIGVEPGQQGKGYGTRMLNFMLDRADQMRRPVFLETSALKNIPWYEKCGLRVFNEIDIGYRLFFMKKD